MLTGHSYVELVGDGGTLPA